MKIRLRDGGRICLASSNISRLVSLPYYDDIDVLDVSDSDHRTLPEPLPVALTVLLCGNNRLSTLPPLPISLRVLNAKRNQLTEWPNMARLRNLEHINLSHNLLGDVSNVCFPRNVKSVTLSDNRIRHFQISRVPIRTDAIDLAGNPLSRDAAMPKETETGTQESSSPALLKNIYEDGHNVHASSVQRSAHKSIDALRTQAETNRGTFADPWELSEQVATDIKQLRKAWRPRKVWQVKKWVRTWFADDLLEAYAKDSSVDSEHGMTYGDLISLIWNVSKTHQHRKEILKVLKQEVVDSRWVCFTGRFTRALNSLSGFIDGVNIEISDKEQLSNRIIQALKKIDETVKPGGMERDVARRQAVSDILTEYSMPTDERDVWLDAV